MFPFSVGCVKKKLSNHRLPQRSALHINIQHFSLLFKHKVPYVAVFLLNFTLIWNVDSSKKQIVHTTTGLSSTFYKMSSPNSYVFASHLVVGDVRVELFKT